MPGMLDRLNDRFAGIVPKPTPTPAKPRVATTQDALDVVPPPPQSAAASATQYIVARFAELGDTLVVVCFNPELRTMIRERFAGHALWFAAELIYFMKRCSTWNNEKKTFVLNPDAGGDDAAFRELFIATCRAKSLFGATVSTEE